MKRPYSSAVLLCAAAVMAVFTVRSLADTAVTVPPVAETAPVPSRGDAADDPAIWIHPQNPALSTIIGTDKKLGLAVYDLAGRQLQFVPAGGLNNVDLRYGFPLGGERVALITAGNQEDGSIAIYRVNPLTRMLENVAARKILSVAGLSREPGSCMYRSPIDGKYYYIIASETGAVEQWQLYDNGAGKVDAEKVRSLNAGFSTEGCVADDALGHLYVGLERHGIWKYKAEPGAGPEHVVVDTTDPAGHLTADVEGLALYRGAVPSGYLVAASQGSDELVIYQRRGNNNFVTTLKIIAGSGVDDVTHMDGIDVVGANLGLRFPRGLLVVQDDINDNGNQNFKLVSWASIANAILSQPALSVTRADARERK